MGGPRRATGTAEQGFAGVAVRAAGSDLLSDGNGHDVSPNCDATECVHEHG